ncbi:MULTISPECIES: electron transfer flavoprotein subunit alpha/FixB family protein [Acidobacteriaceae]|uniref:electron transfer flavoprotein subunit alpha/FixB family protein n=1 Tax=Acidobacteriaceae TaxID=204434 RepID=UPI00131E9694|nr:MULTISPECIES: electron transfer flavoprotein subunit alpha/FixB family protein [Acidobacteriaceae]MDW5267326.1 electron transfer flavoprotein subunit alpha/FixB family protein [Edaphobacter sp.]
MNGVLVLMEQHGGKWNRMSFEALAAGQQLAAKLGAECSAAVIGDAADTLAPELAGKKLAKIFTVQHALLQTYTSDGYVAALEQLVKQTDPAYVLLPHTYQVRDFAPALATRFKQVLISDVIAVHDGPVFVRQLLQGKLNADYKHSGTGPCFISVQAGTFRAEAVAAGTATVEDFTPQLEASQIRNKPGEPFREAAQTVDLSAAPLIVSVGRGIGEQENISIVEELATALGAELAASRPICDNGWLPMERQVGSSGQTVSPKLYLAIGISGAIQHLVGMKGSKTVIAINKDENAPIFEVADYGVVGDLFEIVPALTKAVLAAKK